MEWGEGGKAALALATRGCQSPPGSQGPSAACGPLSQDGSPTQRRGLARPGNWSSLGPWMP